MSSEDIFQDIIPLSKIDFWIKHRLNVLLEGKHGVGKTSIILSAFKRHGLNCLYLSGSTLDPWVDVVGVPKEQEKDGVKYLDLVRPKAFAFDEVDCIFIDEYNRSHKKVRNAVMELIQFKSVNGKRFKNLKFVWAAINPDGDEENNYQVEPIDPAQIDRFHVHYKLPYKLSIEYLSSKYNPEKVKNIVEWWTSLKPELKNSFSPRRLDYVLRAVKEGGDVADFLPPSIPKNIFMKAYNGDFASGAPDGTSVPSTGVKSNNPLMNRSSPQVVNEVRNDAMAFRSKHKLMSNEEAVAFFVKHGITPRGRISSTGRLLIGRKMYTPGQAQSVILSIEKAFGKASSQAGDVRAAFDKAIPNLQNMTTNKVVEVPIKNVPPSNKVDPDDDDGDENKDVDGEWDDEPDEDEASDDDSPPKKKKKIEDSDEASEEEYSEEVSSEESEGMEESSDRPKTSKRGRPKKSTYKEILDKAKKRKGWFGRKTKEKEVDDDSF